MIRIPTFLSDIPIIMMYIRTHYTVSTFRRLKRPVSNTTERCENQLCTQLQTQAHNHSEGVYMRDTNILTRHALRQALRDVQYRLKLGANSFSRLGGTQARPARDLRFMQTRCMSSLLRETPAIFRKRFRAFLT